MFYTNLVDRGNTVLVIEHNMDVVKTADWVIDLGPEGEHRVGKLLLKGLPKDCKTRYTRQDNALHRAIFPRKHQNLGKAKRGQSAQVKP